MKITNCNCAKLVDCGCMLSFDTWQNNTISVLSVGNLVGGSCALDEYVIDWYRDGHHAMVSGKGYDPDIQTFHPFTGLSAVPVEPGQWKPVLRYVVIGGEKLYAQKHKCQSWCMDLQSELPSINVPFITVTALSCGLIGRGDNQAFSGYDFAIRYETTQDFSLATRTVRVLLNSSGTTGYVAVRFGAMNVADQIEVFYKEETTPIGAYIVGVNLPANNPSSTPQEIDHTTAFMVANLEDRVYQSGDYLTIKVKPSVKEPGNFNTIWRIDLKCLPRGAFECNLFHPGIRTIDPDTVDLIWNPVDCRYELTFYTINQLGSNYIWTNFNRYFQLVNTGTTQTTANYPEGWYRIYHRKNTTTSMHTAYSNPPYVNMAGYFTATKTGNILTFEFSNQTDYQAYKTAYQNVLILAAYKDYSSDKTSHLHYKFFHVEWRETMLSCGDTYVGRMQRYHISSPVTFDDTNRVITIEMLNTTNGVIQEDCNNLYSVADGFINSAASDITKADWSGSTVCRSTYPFNFRWLTVSKVEEITRTTFYHVYYQLESLDTVCKTPGWVTMANGNYVFRLHYTRTTLTNPADALNNFRVETQLNTSTGELTGTWVIVYEKQNGHQIIP